MKCEYCGRGEPGNPACPALFEHFDDYGTGTIDKAATARAVEDCRAATRARALRAAERRAAEVREVYRAGEVAKRIESPDAEVSDAASAEASADALRALAGWDDARR